LLKNYKRFYSDDSGQQKCMTRITEHPFFSLEIIIYNRLCNKNLMESIMNVNRVSSLIIYIQEGLCKRLGSTCNVTCHRSWEQRRTVIASLDQPEQIVPSSSTSRARPIDHSLNLLSSTWLRNSDILMQELDLLTSVFKLERITFQAFRGIHIHTAF
jgi:hypothetical protein